MILYLDTQIAVWLSSAKLNLIPTAVQRRLDECDLKISPMAMLELEYLFEINRIDTPSNEILTKLHTQIGLAVCDYPFPSIIAAAFHESWTRDPFDRIIVAHARANQSAWLVSADQMIKKHYPKTLW